MTLSAGMTVRSRGQRCVVVDARPIVGGEAPSNCLRLRALEGPLRGQEWPVVDTLEQELKLEELPPLSLDRVGRDARFRLLHDAFQLTLAPPPTALLPAGRSRSGRRAEWRDLGWDEKNIVPHYFLAPSQSERIAPSSDTTRAGYCSVTGQTNERTCLTSLVPAHSAAGHSMATLSSGDLDVHRLFCMLANSFVFDWLMRLRVSMNLSYFFWYSVSTPRPSLKDADADSVLQAGTGLLPLDSAEVVGICQLGPQGIAAARAQVDSAISRLYGLTTEQMAALLQNFPLLDRDQPSLPCDGFIAYDKKGRPKLKPRSFITRDKVLLEYFRLLGETPPGDIVDFFAEAGVDIDGGKVLAGAPPADPFNPPIAATGPIRNLEERVRLAEEELGAVAYVPTVRKKPTDEALTRIAALEARLASEPERFGAGKEVVSA